MIKLMKSLRRVLWDMVTMIVDTNCSGEMRLVLNMMMEMMIVKKICPNMRQVLTDRVTMIVEEVY